VSKKRVCIIGAGISGISLYNRLDYPDVEVVLLEKQPFPGGQAVMYGCKAADECVNCGVCLVRDEVGSLAESATRQMHVSAIPHFIMPFKGNQYYIKARVIPNPIDWRSCIDCGKCAEICPEGAVRMIAGWSRYIDDSCTQCGKCVNVCPSSAIAMERALVEREFTVDAVVLATGFVPFDPSINAKYGMGGSGRVITGNELESLFYRETYLPVPDVKKLAFVQCVGSRNTAEGKSQCSRACCAYALRMGNRLKKEFPKMTIDFYYMDIQSFGKDFAGFHGKVSKNMQFRRTLPVNIRNDEKPVLQFESLTGCGLEQETYDLVVLSHGMCPSGDAPELAGLLGVDLDSNGFFNTDFSAKQGVFAEGTCRKPMRIDECICDAESVSAEIIQYLGVK